MRVWCLRMSVCWSACRHRDEPNAGHVDWFQFVANFRARCLQRHKREIQFCPHETRAIYTPYMRLCLVSIFIHYTGCGKEQERIELQAGAKHKTYFSIKHTPAVHTPSHNPSALISYSCMCTKIYILYGVSRSNYAIRNI